MGIRPVGRPRQRRQEDVMEDLKNLKVKNWKEMAKYRRFTLLPYITVNTTTIEYNANATCFDLQQSSSG